MSTTPKVSVIIAAYAPGDGFTRVMDSLDAQTLPQEEFETIVVDDGSPDDTYERLTALAATRPNMRVERIENSGWPSRPRNVGTDLARGEYVIFMDHDDSLFPDGLRAAYEFAKANRSDVVSPKESRTNDPWWMLIPLFDGNRPNVLPDGDIDLLRPMVPHKLYRREFLNEHGIRFPEGRRVLWEDNYQNVEVWRHAEVVSLFAETPVYVWHESPSNSSKSYGPMSAEFWDRLDDLVASIDTTLDTPEYAAARRSALMHEHRWRLLHRLTHSTVGNKDGANMDRAYERATAIQDRYIPVEWDADLGTFDRLRAALIRAKRPDLVRVAQELETRIRLQVKASRVRWDGGVLRFHIEARLFEGLKPLAFRAEGDRLFRVVPDAVREAVAPETLEVTKDVEQFELLIAVRDRGVPVSWPVPSERTVRREVNADGTVGMVVEAEAELDLATAQVGRPLGTSVWDTTVQTRWGGLGRRASPKAKGSAVVLTRGRAAVAYANTKGALSIDTAERLRSPVGDGGLPKTGPIGRTGKPFRLSLPRIVVADPTEVELTLEATADDGTVFESPARLVGDEDGARLESRVSLGAGGYALTTRVAGGEASVRLPRRLTVRRDGVLMIHRPAGPRVRSLRDRAVRKGRGAIARMKRIAARRAAVRNQPWRTQT